MKNINLIVIEKGQVLTAYYRCMNKNGGYTWLQSCATVVCSTKTSDEQNIICVNYVISNRENENLVLDCCQLEQIIESIKNEDVVINKGSGSSNDDSSTEGQTANCNDKKESSPKAENYVHASRRQGRCPNGLVNTAITNMALIKSSPTQNTGNIENSVSTGHTTVAIPQNITTNVTKRKRKNKSILCEEIQSESNVSDENEQPKAKIKVMEPSSSRNIVEDQQKTPHQTLLENEKNRNTEPTVKELENAMSKHLPAGNTGAATAQSTTDFSADALLREQENEKSTTIQWIGAPRYQQPSSMPATALLRQLYANRESVIRATARQTSTSVFYGEHQTAPLPTPPGSESSYENQYLQLHTHNQKSSSDAFTNLVSSYGGYHASIDYHNAMTPPSSVSPRDNSNNLNSVSKATAPHASSSYEFSDTLRSSYSTPSNVEVIGTPSLPLKPQPYSAAMHHPHSGSDSGNISYSNLEQPQYFTPHSSFHLYKSASAAF